MAVEVNAVLQAAGPAATLAGSFRSHFRCFNGCGGSYPVDSIVYLCPHCGGLLEVHHDVDALVRHAPAEWRKLLDSRAATTRWPYGGGVWSMKEWVAPELRAENVVSMYEGNSNLFWADRFGKSIGLDDLWVKLCGNSHTGSFKDLGMTVLVSVVKQMIADGSPVRAVACASTGDTSAALAAYAAAAGIPAVVFLPRNKVSDAQLVQPLAHGAHVLALDTDFDGCMRVVREVTQDNSIYLANSMNSLRIEGQKTVGVEIVRQFDWTVPDWIIIPAGNLGNVSALYKGLKLLQDLGIITRLPRLVAAQASRANPFYQSFCNNFAAPVAMQAEATQASAIRIGAPVSYSKAVQAILQTDGLVEQASEQELATAAALADKTGMYACPHTAVALAALCKLRQNNTIQPGARVVVISTAHGLKFSGFKSGYHAGSLPLVTSDHANPPLQLPATAAAVRAVLDSRLPGLPAASARV